MTETKKLERVDLILDTESVAWLDAQRLTIRQNVRVRVSRSELVRSLLWGLRETGTDFSTCQTDEDCMAVFLRDDGQTA